MDEYGVIIVVIASPKQEELQIFFLVFQMTGNHHYH